MRTSPLSGHVSQTRTSRTSRTGASHLIALSLLVFAARDSAFAQIRFYKIVDTTVNVPQVPGTFSSFTRTGRRTSANYGDRTVFYAEDNNGAEGVYSFTESEGIRIVANASTSVPMVPEAHFESFLTFDVGPEGVVFIGTYRNERGFLVSGLYHFDPDWVDPNGIEPDGLITRIADTSTAMPGGEGNPLDDDDDLYFSSFGPGRPHIFGNNLVFYGSSGIAGGYQEGIFLWKPTTGIANPVDTNSEIPGAGVAFRNFLDTPFGSREELVFSTWEHPFNYSTAVYRMSLEGPISVVVDLATPVPGNPDSFNQFPESVIMDSGEVAFIGQSLRDFGASNYGIYLAGRDGGIEKILDATTRIPGGYGTFGTTSSLGTSGDRLVFQSFYKVGDEIHRAIFAFSEGVIRPVVRPGDLIGGREVARVFMESDSLEGDTVHFLATFKDAPNQDAIYLADIGGIENSPTPPIYVGGPGADILTPVDAFSSDLDIPSFRAAEIALATDATVYSVTFEGTYAAAQTIGADAFTLQFLNDDNGANGDLPGSIASSAMALEVVSRIDTGVDEFGLDVYRYQANLASPIAIPAGSYWMSIANDTSDDVDDNWRWTIATRGYSDPFTAQSSASQSGPYSSSLRGTPVFTLLATVFDGVQPRQPASPARIIVQRPRRFQSTLVGRRSRAQTLRITNLGGSALGRLRVASSGKAKRDFLLSQPASKSLAPGTSTAFKVRFRPRATGIRKATLTVRSSAAAARAAVTGSGRKR